MAKKIFTFLIINIIIFISIEIIVKITLKRLNYPSVYRLGNLDENRYDYLTGFYNLPNTEEKITDYYYQGTDQYGFNLDGERFVSQDLSKKDENTFRIFLLGASMIQGRALVDRYDPISARLEKMLNKKMGNSKVIFEVINAGTNSFITSQDLALAHNKILYAFKPDHLIFINGATDATSYLGPKFYLSNSHYYQRAFQENITKTSKNFFFLLDDWLSKNISTYFLLKKIVEKTTGIFLFEKNTREIATNKMSKKNITERIYRYFHNINLISKLASKNTYVSVFFQPQMSSENIKKLSNNDQKIYNDFNKQEKFYSSNKKLFNDGVRKKIKYINSSNEFENKKYFQLIDIHDLFDSSEHSGDFYSDRAHYTPLSREIITKRIFQDIEKKIRENLKN